MKKIIHCLYLRKNAIILLFLVFLSLRLFVGESSILLADDHLKFLEAANRFPHHTLYNNQLYLLHPPLYPYAIHFFNLIFAQDHIASISISLISSVVIFFVIFHFFMMLTKNFSMTFFILAFYTLSDNLITASNAPLRESFLIMLIFLSLYFYVKGIKFNDKKSLVLAAIFGSILALTSDHVILLIPALGISYIFFNNKNIKYAILPVLIILLFYGSWTLVKYVQYTEYDFYPNGHSGIPLNTQKVGLLQTIDPQFFESYEGAYIAPGIASVIKRFAFTFGYIFNIQPFSVPQGLNFTTMKFLLQPHHIVYVIILYIPLAFIMFYGSYYIVRNALRTKKIHNNINLYMIILFLLFAFPITQKLASPRYILTANIFFFYFMGHGFMRLFQKNLKLNLRSMVIPFVCILLLAVAPFWIYYNQYFVLFNKKAVSAQNTGDFINANIPKGAGIMAQPGYSAKLNYLTDNRVIGLHPRPERLAELIEYFNTSYIVVGRYYTYDAYHLSKDSVGFIRNNPGKFELIATVQEDYSKFFSKEDPASTDEVYIYKVIE